MAFEINLRGQSQNLKNKKKIEWQEQDLEGTNFTLCVLRFLRRILICFPFHLRKILPRKSVKFMRYPSEHFLKGVVWAVAALAAVNDRKMDSFARKNLFFSRYKAWHVFFSLDWPSNTNRLFDGSPVVGPVYDYYYYC